MTKRLLIDATHAEETRVVVLDGNRLEDYDIETSTKKQLKGNIYLAKVVRVEPSLQAAFVEYGGNRHGFLAFSEIHPDYFQIPIADRQRLLEMQEQEAREDEAAEDEAAHDEATKDEAADDDVNHRDLNGADPAGSEDATPAEDAQAPASPAPSLPVPASPAPSSPAPAGPAGSGPADAGDTVQPEPDHVTVAASIAPQIKVASDEAHELFPPAADAVTVPAASEGEVADTTGEGVESLPDEPPPESIGGDAETGEDSRAYRAPPRFMRSYKLQEVIRRRQILLVQVVKEERGTKGAALTTYISLAGRFCVLMPNSPRGGGISRKITSLADRRRLKDAVAELELPRGMGLIVRTAGANRPKPEIKRDCEYLLSQWDQIRDLTMQSMAPALIYEEASLIKRAIRDVYSRDVDEVLVDGEAGWRAAHDFMRMLMPSHARKVQLWKGPDGQGGQPLFAQQQVEAQLDSMLSPTVQLKSGGYLVISQTEALVAIDVNSGRSTRERGIEETALRTNMEASDEVARQLRLRDLAGLIVIDFIDMEVRRNNAAVERRLKDALKIDRARIQIGSISHFGLLEMSRQRLRPSLAETTFVACPHCGGTGHVRSTDSAALHVLRDIEEEGAKRRASEIVVHVASPIALYILNHKRGRLSEIEARYAMRVSFASDDALLPPQIRIDRVRAAVVAEVPAPALQTAAASVAEPSDVETLDDATAEDAEEISAVAQDAPRPGETAEEVETRRRRRRRRRGGRRDDMAASEAAGAEAAPSDGSAPSAPAEELPAAIPPAADPPGSAGVADAVAPVAPEAAEGEGAANKRRGRRGGRRRRRDPADAVPQPAELNEAPEPTMPAYAGPTPADPFGGGTFDIFDAIEQAEQERAQALAAAPAWTEQAEATGRSPEPAPDLAVVAAPEPDPAAEPQHATAEAATPEPTPEEPASDRIEAVPVDRASDGNGAADAFDDAPKPAHEMAPIVVGAADIGERKRGWWRR